MKKILSLPSLYVVLWMLYFTQGTILPFNSIWARIALLVFLTISIYFAIATFVKFKVNNYLKALGILLIMFTIYGLISFFYGGSLDYLKIIYLSLLPTFTFYIFTMRGQIDVFWIRIMFFVFVGVVVIQYFYYMVLLEDKGVDAEKATINVGSNILALLPLIFYWKNKPIIQYVLLALLLAWLLSTIKRGAIIIGALCTFYFLFTSVRGSSKKVKWYIWLLVIVFLIVGTRYLLDFFNNNEYLQLRMENTLEGDSSGRDLIYENAWNVFLNSSFITAVFGHGSWATIRLIGIEAHNDWLEILVNQGVFGITVYLLYWIVFFKTYKREKDKQIRPILGMLIIIYFSLTLFSMSYSDMTLPANLALGYSLAFNRNES